MTIHLLSHVGLYAVNLREAERYYRDLFALEVAFREAETPQGWRRLPEGKTWDDAEEAGIQLEMVMLHREGLALAIEKADTVSSFGALSHFGLKVDETELARFRQVLPRFGCQIVHEFERTLVFDDRYGVRWEPSLADYSDPRQLGAHPDRFLEI